MKTTSILKRLTALGLSAAIVATGTALAVTADSVYKNQLEQAEANGTIYTDFHTGRWDNQKIEGIAGSYSVYVPSNFEYCSPAVMILTPDNMTAANWLDSELGKKWQATADTNGIALVVVEPQDGASWNVSLNASARDDEAYLYQLYGILGNKSDANPAEFDMNERALYLVGYNEGGTAANKMAMMWPALFAGAVSVGGNAVSTDVMNTLGNSISYPFAEATQAGREANNLPNHQIPVRFWEIQTSNSLAENVSYWSKANGLSGKGSKEITGDFATILTNVDEKGAYEPEQVWYSTAEDESSVSSDTIYSEFLADAQRFVGDPGGYLAWTIDDSNDGKHGFFWNEEKVDGFTRRWYTYVPKSYDGTKDYPMVVAMHGYSSAITAFTGDSRWQNVADDYGIIVVFPQAYVNDAGYSGSSCFPVPVWNNYSTIYHHTTYDKPDDVGFIKYLVDTTKKKYAIDAARVYATGHSNGSGMTYMLAQDAPEYFTAVAPIGFNWGSYPGYSFRGTDVDYSGCKDNKYILPVWCMTAEFDVGEAVNYSPDTKNGRTVSYWKAYNHAGNVASKTSEVRATNAEHTFSSTTYPSENGAPLVRFTQVSNSCHAYMEDQAYMIWEEFFSKYTRDADGTLKYNGEKVVVSDSKSASFTDIADSWAKEHIKKAVDQNGLFAGTSNTTFGPNVNLTRAMLVTVLYRMDINANAWNASNPFADVAEDTYYTEAVKWAYKNGVVAGTSATTFTPDRHITREELVTMLYNFAKYKEYDISAATSLAGYTDQAALSAFAKTPMTWAVANHIVSGRTSTTLVPKGTATRAETAAMLNQFLDAFAK